MTRDDETVNRIIELWNDKKSAGEIAREFHVTRSAIMGKISRLRKAGVFLRGLTEKPQRVKKIQVKAESRREKRRRENRKWGERREAKRTVIDVTFDPIQQFVFNFGPAKTNIDIMQLTPKSCRYIVGKDQRRGALYCGKNMRYRSYCEEHAAMCYVLPTHNS
jgi:hypothetical protein